LLQGYHFIKDSKKRRDLQNKLAFVYDTTNKKYKEFVSVKFSITISDEIQGLLKSGSPAFEIIGYIEKKVYPYKMRFGIGEGYQVKV